MIFDRYQENSIKDQTGTKRTGGTNVHYRIDDETKIEAITMKKLLSSIETKHDLTKYLGDHLASHLRIIKFRYAI